MVQIGGADQLGVPFRMRPQARVNGVKAKAAIGGQPVEPRALVGGTWTHSDELCLCVSRLSCFWAPCRVTPCGRRSAAPSALHRGAPGRRQASASGRCSGLPTPRGHPPVHEYLLHPEDGHDQVAQLLCVCPMHRFSSGSRTPVRHIFCSRYAARLSSETP